MYTAPLARASAFLVFMVFVSTLGSARADLNGDGLDDPVIATSGVDRVCLSDGVGGFSSCAGVDAAHFSWGVALGDVDGDDNLDAVFATTTGQRNRVCLGDGAGGFGACTDVDPASVAWISYDVDLGDMNNDGHLDAVFVGVRNAVGNGNLVCLGDGAGGFTCSTFDVVPGAFFEVNRGVALGDMNNDGNLDAVVATLLGSSRTWLCLGDGAGGFSSCTGIDTATNAAYGVAVGDMNNDGNLDAVVATSSTNRLCLGDGAGAFTCSNIDATEVTMNWDVAVGDVDADGNLDVLFASNISTRNNRVCLGDGAGGFACGDIDNMGGTSYSVAVGHLDGDGNLDAVFTGNASFFSNGNRVCLGDGAGGFTTSTFRFDPLSASESGFAVALPRRAYAEEATKTPVEMLECLMADVEDIGLAKGIATSLLSKLENALAKLENDNPKDDGAAANQVEAFVNQVEALSGKKMDAGDADDLTDAANALLDALDA